MWVPTFRRMLGVPRATLQSLQDRTWSGLQSKHHLRWLNSPNLLDHQCRVSFGKPGEYSALALKERHDLLFEVISITDGQIFLETELFYKAAMAKPWRADWCFPKAPIAAGSNRTECRKCAKSCVDPRTTAAHAREFALPWTLACPWAVTCLSSFQGFQAICRYNWSVTIWTMLRSCFNHASLPYCTYHYQDCNKLLQCCSFVVETLLNRKRSWLMGSVWGVGSAAQIKAMKQARKAYISLQLSDLLTLALIFEHQIGASQVFRWFSVVLKGL